ncbi:MarR family winged helix-turn-helix transcriptional regulator [Streptomyces sp. NBC_01320]|uniref:MarR family winged helix-turn-helix transcriptional regulator n=1 Tax=Streptomyces sp. NBC_01320 TaxID=2903824 RepID=UPI002E134123|nr:MarR family winged helix-turn-helix transcriptional regulator [Streptomyces sp. NBC_01320]
MAVGEQLGPRGRSRRGNSSSSPDGGAQTAPEFDLTSNVNYLLRRAHARADFLFNRLMADLGLTPRQAAILSAVGVAPGCNLTELSKITGIDRGTIAEMVPRLVRRGLLLERRDPDDARAKSLVCTDAGTAACRRVSERTPELTSQVLGSLPVEYHALLIKVLRLLVGVEIEERTTTSAAAHDAGGSTRTKG